ncbi:MAG TPA: universal stress protein [Steroidobacteraceae bacterium]|nr:universal stress protein [Steroidobacteraceae bacterium]
MRRVRRILVAVRNPSVKPSPAVLKSVQLGKAFGAEVELFHALAAPVYFDAYSSLNDHTAEVERSTREDCLAKLDASAARLRHHGVSVSTACDWDYPVHEAILRRAAQSNADLIVADLHAGRHIVPGLLQLSDWELLRLSPIPVLLVRKRGAYHKPTILAAVDPSHADAKPLQLDARILDIGQGFAKALKGSLHAVHAYLAIPPLALGASALDPGTVDELERQAAVRASRMMRHLLKQTKIPASRRHIVSSHPLLAIRDTAKETNSSIVVMGAISRSGIKRLLIGNTAESLLDRLSCDILIVKPQGFVGRVPRARRGARLVPVAQPVGM